MDTLVFVIIIQAFIFGAFCAFIAKEKNRDQAGWFFSGFFFSFIALLALIAVPKLDKPAQQELPKIHYPPPSPPTPTKTKLIRLAIILVGLIAIFVIAFLLNK